MNVPEGQQAGFVHSNKYPYLKQNQWYMVFTDAEVINFFNMEKLSIKERVFTKEIKERMQMPGRTQLNIILKNDSYKGFDKLIRVEFTVLKEVQRAQLEYNDEDIQAMKQPNLLQSVMEINPNGDSDEEEESDTDTAVSSSTAPQRDACCDHDHGHGNMYAQAQAQAHAHAHANNNANQEAAAATPTETKKDQ